jgi:gliding motility-associated-like protein
MDFTFSDSVCLGTATSFSGVVVSSPDPVNSWRWDYGDGSPFGTTQNTTHVFTTPGNHTVTLYASATGGAECETIVVKNVFVVNKPTAAFTNNILCQSTSVTLTDGSFTSDGTPITGWWWDLGNGQFSTQQNPSTTYNVSGSITVRHVAINAKGCISDTLTQTINISAKPIANFGYSNPLCQGAPVQFSDSTLVAGGTATQWNWVYNGVVWSTQQNPSRSFPPGSHTVRLISTSNLGCVSDTTDKTFVILPAPDISFAFSDACSKDTVDFTATDNSATATSWRWDFGDGGISTARDTQHVYTAAGTYRVKLIAFASNGCSNDTLQRDIMIYGTNTFAGNDTITPSGRPLQLQGSGGVSYEWTPSTGLNDPFISNPIAILYGTQMYTYVLRAYTPLGCESFDTIKVQVYQAPEIWLPNAFSPNNNGVNDLYLGKPIGIREFKYLKIFNRYGQQVFSTDDPLHGWDGTFKGKPQGSGTYVVIARGIDYRGLVVERQGTVMLIR